VKYLDDFYLERQNDQCSFEKEQERLSNMKTLLKHVLENTQIFDTR
jgi:hypothetical protein